MPRYECTICQKVYVGWAVKYKYEGRCPDCGSELREISNNYKGGKMNKKRKKKSRKEEWDNWLNEKDQ